MKSAYGYSVHAGVDEDGFIHRQTVTPGNVHDSRERDRLLLCDEAALYADAAYSSRVTREALARLGIADRVQHKGYRDHPLSEADKRRNAGIAVVRSGVERAFAVYKRCYPLRKLHPATGVPRGPFILLSPAGGRSGGGRPAVPQRCAIPTPPPV